MTQEFKDIIDNYIAHSAQHKAVLATVVALDGSSYRKPGVRMLILDNDMMFGAVSGGCVEKEILRQSQDVLRTGQARMMHYDGRYRLGCEGILYILIEPFSIQASLKEHFDREMEERRSFDLYAYYNPKEGSHFAMGSSIRFSDGSYYSLSGTMEEQKEESNAKLLCYKQSMSPCFQLMIIGTEHDAASLSLCAAATGWEVSIICGLKNSKLVADFPGAKQLTYVPLEEIEELRIDSQTAIVIMTHNYAKDLKYLLALKNTRASYIGILGAKKRKEKLLMEFLEYCPEVDPDFLDLIHGPSGLDIGAIGPKEIAVAIVAEIISVFREQKKLHLELTNDKMQLQ